MRAAEAGITYRGAVYPWHCDHVGHMNAFPAELLARAREGH
ncbi:MAG: hypothetical protein Q8R01_06840 [Ramlibacter sp.]|nr:hypothetical protein [Ramlibacter sp.]